MQNIACRNANGWELRAAMPAAEQGSYQTASNDSVLDELIKGDALMSEQEIEIIQRSWEQ